MKKLLKILKSLLQAMRVSVGAHVWELQMFEHPHLVSYVIYLWFPKDLMKRSISYFEIGMYVNFIFLSW
jgi:hypothetical protein